MRGRHWCVCALPLCGYAGAVGGGGMLEDWGELAVGSQDGSFERL